MDEQWSQAQSWPGLNGEKVKIAEHFAVYVIRICVANSVLFLLLAERIQHDANRVRKLMAGCLLIIAVLTNFAFVARLLEHYMIEHVLYKSMEATNIFVNFGVVYFNIQYMGEHRPDHEAGYVDRVSVGSFVLVAMAFAMQFFTTFNGTYLANCVVSCYTISVLSQCREGLKTRKTVFEDGAMKSPEQSRRWRVIGRQCLTEYVILLLNVVVCMLTAPPFFYTVYPFKGTIYVFYWLKIYYVLLECGAIMDGMNHLAM
mmetsp:Transcript_43924/g.80268  ORF Transcript_43924/g.80268 Transcript_43924/m.80268 type:complete len:258 (-) Transcript_43924:180-953(-)